MIAAYHLITRLSPPGETAEGVSERLQRQVAAYFRPEQGDSQSELPVRVMDLAVRRESSAESAAEIWRTKPADTVVTAALT